MLKPLSVDIVVVGSGFAGSLAALILNQLDFNVALIDKATHPRFSIGESSTPTGNMILKDLAARYDLPQLTPLSTFGTWQDAYPHLRLGRKRGFTYFKHTKHSPFITDDKHSNELLVAASKDDYYSDMHWHREDVDAFLAAEVHKAGISFYENTRIDGLTKGNTWKLQCNQKSDHSDSALHIEASFIIDATGRGGFLGQNLGIKDHVHRVRTNTHSLYGHVDDLSSWHDYMTTKGFPSKDHPYHCDDAAVHHLIDGGWIWMLRFATGRTSAGIVMDRRRHKKIELDFENYLSDYPSLSEWFSTASFVAPTNPPINTGRIQYRWAQTAGANWAMLPHTAGFIDPLHSTGIAHALCGLEKLVYVLQHHWKKPSLPDALAQYDLSVQRELDHIDMLVHGCYMALDHFELLTAFTMLYFASAITYEEARLNYVENDPFNRDFLCAEDTTLASITQSCYQDLYLLINQGSNSNSIEAYIRSVEKQIEPYNTAGLFSPAIPNMYAYTATV